MFYQIIKFRIYAQTLSLLLFVILAWSLNWCTFSFKFLFKESGRIRDILTDIQILWNSQYFQFMSSLFMTRQRLINFTFLAEKSLCIIQGLLDGLIDPARHRVAIGQNQPTRHDSIRGGLVDIGYRHYIYITLCISLSHNIFLCAFWRHKSPC